MQSRLQTSNEAKDVIKKWIAESADNIRASMPARVVGYDAATNRASVKPIGTYTTPDYQELEYPVIHNVPMQFPCGVGGTAGVTFPVKAGDGCIVIFADREIEQFLSGGFCDDMRSHSMNDAYAIPGLYSQAVQTQRENANDVCLFNEGSLVVLNGDTLKITLSDGTTATFGGGDLKVNGISLVHHVHGGITRGGAKTDEPS
jgi:hypothetical protein